MSATARHYYNAATETMSGDELHVLQMDRLAGQLNYLVEHAPFYAEKFASVGAEPNDIGSPADLARLPFTEKSELRQSQAEESPVAGAVEEIGATLLPVGTGAADRLIASIQAMRATVLATTPSHAIYLAEIARNDLGVEPAKLGIKNVMVGAEPGGGVPEIRARIESEWNATLTESIGNVDVITIHSAECEAQDGCHFMVPDYLLMEIINPDSGSVIAPDQPELEGVMVFTHLDRACKPMLRFRSRDHVVMKTSACACGRTGPRLKCVGWTDDMLILRGVNVWPSAIKGVVMSFRPEISGEMVISLDTPGPKVTPPLRIKVE